MDLALPPHTCIVLESYLLILFSLGVYSARVFVSCYSSRCLRGRVRCMAAVADRTPPAAPRPVRSPLQGLRRHAQVSFHHSTRSAIRGGSAIRVLRGNIGRRVP